MTVHKTPAPVSHSDSDAAPHALTIDALAAQHDVQLELGLSAEQLGQRKKKYGPNRLPEAPPRSAWRVFFAQFKSILIMILIGAATLAALIGNTKDALVIVAVVLINATVGFYQEYRAEQSLAALKGMLPVRARVRREGKKIEVPAEDLVPGDVVLLEAGDPVPADGRLLLAAGLEVDESALTGESLPVGKQLDALQAPDVPLAERTNMLYMNTLLTRGRAEIIVTATGAHTEMGQLSQELAATTEVPTPLQLQLDQLGKRLGAIALTLVALLSGLALWRGDGLAHIALDAIALAVAAMPEGLPVVVTVTLALGMRNMARHQAIVKRLASVETLGCTTVICSDKTGTLTLNQMTARAFFYQGARFDVSGEGYATDGEISAAGAVDAASALPDLHALLLPLVACNDSRVDNGKVIGDPMEGALLVLAHKGGLNPAQVAETLPRLAEIPFDAVHKFMATFHREDGQVRMFVKGAPDVLLALCTQVLNANTQGAEGAEVAGGPLDVAARQLIEAHYTELGNQGLRGLLVASRSISDSAFDASGDLAAWVRDLSFVGLIGLMDPPRAEAKVAIAECRAAGVTVKMITGDHQLTASAIAAELGLKGKAMTGAELDRMNAEQLAAAIDNVAVFARVTPTNKVKIVRALQKKGHVVAMTGDGVNDAPALKSADIGVAMGSGTAVAKAAATVVLLDDNFATLVSAVRQGRTLYDNIVKFVRFQLSTTIGAILSVFLAPLLGLPEPFTAVQILWVAIIMDGPPAVSLALDAARPGIMHEPPRSRSTPLLTLNRLGKVIAYGVTMTVGTLAVLYFCLQAGMAQQAPTLAFTTFVLFQFFNVFNARVERGTAFNRQFFKNAMLWASLAGVIGLQVVAVHWPPAQSIFGTWPLSLGEWGIATGVAATILLLEEARKLTVALFERLRSGTKKPGPRTQ
ncbi:HAD-IC family P-type ATPase [Polaromonas sp.]|uniref:cation-translocating P-type ATPase n=1 Tax=Polaromonas sp. TaxID=1869339 RepID=UPI0017EDA7A9|nr:HAD-IC family P-type ATPase [Polaromonas sp.]NMM05557.1 HAD-IC family P-type ATPase [Polaromonas sp.]